MGRESNMYSVAVCDDDLKALEAVKECLSEFEGKNIKVEYFDSGKSLKDTLGESRFDAIIIDIEMPEINGIELANYARSLNKHLVIIFISNKEDMVYDTIRFSPFAFIRKRYISDELESVMARFINVMSEDTYMLCMDKKNKVYLAIYEIIYIESVQHQLRIHTENGDYFVSGNLYHLEKTLKQYYFARVHKGFMVNVRWVKSISSDEVRTKSGDAIPIGRRYKDGAIEIYSYFKRRMYD